MLVGYISLLQVNRLFARMAEALTKDDLITIEAPDIRASRVFYGQIDQKGLEVGS